jgi:hypothetical protein
MALKQAPDELSIFNRSRDTEKKMRKEQIQQDYGYIRNSASRKRRDLGGSNIAINISSTCQTNI